MSGVPAKGPLMSRRPSHPLTPGKTCHPQAEDLSPQQTCPSPPLLPANEPEPSAPRPTRPLRQAFQAMEGCCLSWTWRKGNPLYCWWEWGLQRVLQRFLKKLKTELPYTQQFHSSIYVRKTKTLIRKRYMHPSVHSTSIPKS